MINPYRSKAVTIFSLIVLSALHSHAQKSSYTDQCVLVKEFLSYTDSTFLNFTKMSKDSPFVILDPHGVLKLCKIDSTTFAFRFKVVSEGEEVENIKKNGIFSANNSHPNVIVFTKTKRKGLTGFGIFKPYNNASAAWVFEKKRKTFILKKNSAGYF